jgi:hypothetical protein
MAVHCAKCGEELMGAVNRCWKCGQVFARRPEMDGLPPVRMERPPAAGEPLEAIVLDDTPAGDGGEHARAAPVAVAAPPAAGFPLPPPVAPTVQFIPKPIVAPPSTSQMIEARRHSLMAMGGTVGAIAVGIFALILALFRFEAAIVGLIGLGLGLWGLHSPKRNWALVGLLLCCLAIGLGAYRGANDLYVYIKSQQPIEMEEPAEEDASVEP